MYTDEDLDTAVNQGIFSTEAVSQFREHMLSSTATPVVDEENFRLLTGFNDIFVVIASGLLLFSAAWFASTFNPVFGPITLAIFSWGLAEFFVRKRKMALPAIMLLISFLAGVAMAPITFAGMPNGLTMIVAMLLTSIFTWLHWKRFRVPITIAAGATAIAAIVLTTGISTYPILKDWLTPLLFISGLCLFLIAMVWDASDTTRQTRNSDVAFWLHLIAAPLMVHPIFSMLGILDSNQTIFSLVLVLVLYVFLTMISLAVDRRAIMVSSLGYVLYAFYALFHTYGFVSYSFALTGICMGASLLLLSAFWHPSRKRVIGFTPQFIKTHLPTAI